MIDKFKPWWGPYLRDIDIKSYEFPWFDEQWERLSRYVVRGWIGSDTKLQGFFIVKPSTEIEVARFCVKPNYRGQGVGTALLSELDKMCVDWKNRLQEVVLHEENALGLNWAFHRGFRAKGTKLNEYPDLRDGIILRREI